MYIDNVTRTAIVAGAMMLAATAGVILVEATGSSLKPQFEAAAAATQPIPVAVPSVEHLQAAMANMFVNIEPQYFRNCVGALSEAKNIGVVPGFVALDAPSPRRGRPGETICSAATQNFHFEIAYFSDCTGGGDLCPVLARVTRDGKYVIFQRD